MRFKLPKKKTMLLCTLIALAVIAGRAHAQTDAQTDTQSQAVENTTGKTSRWSGWTIGAGVVVQQTPYKDYGTQVGAIPLVMYDGERMYLEGTKVGVHIINTEQHTVNANIVYSALNFDASESDDQALKRLDDRKATLMAGLEYKYSAAFGELSVGIAADVLGRNKGFTGHVGYMYPLQINKLRLELGAGLTWQSSKYNNYYYGVSQKEAHRSGLSQHTVGSGVSPELSVRAFYAINNHWQVFGLGSVNWLSSKAKDSPMTDRSYSAYVGVGLLYAF